MKGNSVFTYAVFAFAVIASLGALPGASSAPYLQDAAGSEPAAISLALLDGTQPPQGPASPPVVAIRTQPLPPLKDLLLSAEKLLEQGRYEDATPLIDQAQQVADSGGTRTERAIILELKGKLLAHFGQWTQAEAALKRSIELHEQVRGLNSQFIVGALQQLTGIYLRQHRLQEASGTAKRALDLAQPLRAQDPVLVASLEDTLAQAYLESGNTAPAEQLFIDARSIMASLGDRPGVGEVDDHLGTLYLYLNQFDKARQFGGEALAILQERFGPENLLALVSELNLAVVNRNAGNFDLAAEGFKHVLTAYERRLGDDHPDTVRVRNDLGWLELARHDPAVALNWFRKSFEGYGRVRRSQGFTLTSMEEPGGVAEREVARTILGLLDAAWDAGGSAPSSKLIDEAFRVAQWVHISRAAGALNQMNARLGAGSDRLAALIREEQDLAAQWRTLEQMLLGAVTKLSGQRDMSAEDQARQKQATITGRIHDIDYELSRDFPAYATLTDPSPISVPDVQKLLSTDEILVQIVTFGDPKVDDRNGRGTYLFLVAHDQAQWRKVEADSVELLRFVSTLRCGLDTTPWYGDNPTLHHQCNELTGVDRAPASGPPFDAAAAFHLFDMLFGDLAPTLSKKTLLLVVPHPLSSLPFQVLLTKAPNIAHPERAEDESGFAWLGLSNPIAVLPSVTSLAGSRSSNTRPPPPEPFIGFGDPDFSNGKSKPRVPDSFREDVTKLCAKPEDGTALALNAQTPRIDQVVRGGRVDLDELRKLGPLPETAIELRCVAKSIGAPDSAVYTGEAATVTSVLAAPLNRYRVVFFATHGLLASEAKNYGADSEPALVMTPPAQLTGLDQGLLTESLVATLHLTADWVVLSACNTAAGSAGGEAMSGLASAFLYAGAKSLLVSHWPVDSTEAVLLTTGAFAQLSADPSIGRAEALRRSMATLIASSTDWHPSKWAPFSLVGEPRTVPLQN